MIPGRVFPLPRGWSLEVRTYKVSSTVRRQPGEHRIGKLGWLVSKDRGIASYSGGVVGRKALQLLFMKKRTYFCQGCGASQ